MTPTPFIRSVSLLDLPGHLVLGAFVFSIPSIYYNSELVEQGQRIFQVLAVLAVATNLHHLNLTRLSLPLISLGTLWIYFSITALLSKDAYLIETLFVWGKFTVIAILLGLLMTKRTLFLAVLAGLAASAIFVVISSRDSLDVARESLVHEVTSSGPTRTSGVFTNANLLGMYAVDAILAAVMLYFNNRNKITFVLAATSTGAAAYLAFFSGSRKAMLGLAFIVLFVIWITVKNRKLSSTTSKLIALCMVAGGIVWIITNPYMMRFSLGEESYQMRGDLANEAWTYISGAPLFGLGYRGFELTSASGLYTHSTPVEVLCNGGMFGFGIYMLLWWGIGRSLYRCLALERDGREVLLLHGVGCYCVLQIINSLASVVIEEPRYLVLAGCVCGYLRTRELELRALGRSILLQPTAEREFSEFGGGGSLVEKPKAVR